jgi:outer membrane receptor protein involved in Fe transport
MITSGTMIALAGSVCVLALAAPVQAQIREYNIAPQSLKSALDAWARQSGVQVIYKSDEMLTVNSAGARGSFSSNSALDAILAGTGFSAKVDPTGAVAIVRSAPSKDLSVNNDSAPIDATEVVVTAQKREERLRDTPVPVTALNTASLTQNNEVHLTDYYIRVPGLNLTTNGEGNSPTLSIRGLSSGDSNPTVGVTIDGIPFGSTVFPGVSTSIPDLDPGDLARIEVLRGPQGTLYGASSLGGLINFVTVDPSSKSLSGRVEAGISGVQDGGVGYDLRGSVNVPINDQLAVRVSGFNALNPGYVHDLLTGDHNSNETTSNGGRLAILWRPTDSLNVKLEAFYQQSHRHGSDEVDPSLLGGLSVQALPGADVYTRVDQEYAAVINYSVGKIELTSNTGYGVDRANSNFDASESGFLSGFAFNGLGAVPGYSGYGVTGVEDPTYRTSKKVSQEFRVLAPLGDRIKWLTGVFYTHENNNQTVNLEAVNGATGTFAGVLENYTQPSTYDEYAIFTNVTVQVTDNFDLQLGGRLSENRQSFSNLKTGPFAALIYGASPSILNSVSGNGEAGTYSFTPRLKISPDAMIYGRISTGYRPGGINYQCTHVTGLENSIIPCNYSADTTQNYEVGAKGVLFAGTLTYDASLYYINWNNIQLTLETDGPQFIQYVNNAGAARSDGLELSLDDRPAQGLDISGWFAYNDAVLTKNLPATSTVNGMKGDQLPYGSKFSGNIDVQQEFPLGDALKGFAGISASYIGDRKGVFTSAPERSIFPAYTRVDLRTGVKTHDIIVNLFVTNVGDTRGILRSGLDSTLPNLDTYIRPRSYGISVDRKF